MRLPSAYWRLQIMRKHLKVNEVLHAEEAIVEELTCLLAALPAVVTAPQFQKSFFGCRGVVAPKMARP